MMRLHKTVYAPSIVLVERYLEKNGWTFFYKERRNICWLKSDHKVYLPASESFGGYERGMYDVFAILAIAEKRDSYDIWRDVVVSEWEDE
jgi:hypothetical protein